MDPTRMSFGLRLVCLESLLGMDEKVALDEDVAGVPAASTSGETSISNPSLPAAVTVAIETAGCRASLGNRGIVVDMKGFFVARRLQCRMPRRMPDAGCRMPDANAFVYHERC